MDKAKVSFIISRDRPESRNEIVTGDTFKFLFFGDFQDILVTGLNTLPV